MYVKRLSLRNFGPFVDLDLSFLDPSERRPRVTLITGENGSGKSIILDAIRGVFGPGFAQLQRDFRRSEKWSVDLYLFDPRNSAFLQLKGREFVNGALTGINPLLKTPEAVASGGPCPNWIADYWTRHGQMNQDRDSYQIDSLQPFNPKSFMQMALQGLRSYGDISRFICHIDYLRGSRDTAESDMGGRLYEILEKIIHFSLMGRGELAHVNRAACKPVIRCRGQKIDLANLGQGALYLIQNLVGTLMKMFAVHLLKNAPLNHLGQNPGFLLMDHAEDQLHPKCQKDLFLQIFELFPNLQIIAATHAPLILASAPDAKLFVCKERDHYCTVVEETEPLANQPVDRILNSPVFGETQPFNQTITRLLDRRNLALLREDAPEREALEGQLKSLNPQYFAHLGATRPVEVGSDHTPL